MRRAIDPALCAMIAAGTLGYFWIWPRDFFPLDEGLYLYESRRLLEGAVFYRDMFELITPGAYYAMAAAFGVFGVDIVVARTVMAVVHTAIAILVFLSCRRLGVRRSFACAAAFAHLAIAFPAMPKANPHWFGTLLTVIVLYALLLVPWRRPSRALALVGVANGALIMVQQQKGMVIAVGVVVVLVLDNLLAPRDVAPRFSSLGRRLALFLAGAAGLAGLSTLLLIVTAGLRPVWESLVLFPLRNYSGQAQCSRWAFRGTPLWQRQFPFPELVRNLPFIAGVGLLRIGGGWILAMDREAVRRVGVATILSIFATLSVSYCPNHVHLAVISPIPMVLLAETAEALFGPVTKRIRALSLVGAAAAILLIALFATEMRKTLAGQRKQYPFAHETAAGKVDFRNPEEIALVDAVRERTKPGDEIFVYPTYPGLYFLSGTTNPTRFQILLADYNGPSHFSEALEVLERRKTRLIAVNAFSVRWKTDPVIAYVARAYRRVPLAVRMPKGRLPHFVLFERKPEVSPAPPAGAN